MTKIGGYQVTGKIGEGGMAVVYKGMQVSLDRPVAIKVLSQKLSDCDEVLERFNQESLIVARLSHPNIIHVIDRGITPDGMPFFVMEFVEGVDLAEYSRKRNLSLNRKIDIIIQICKALSYAHRNGVIHRDVKPANILIDSEGTAKVVDFGIAQFFGSKARNANLTRVDTVMGTLAYMSPEQQVSAKKVTAASDLYSLGVVMYELLTGEKPLGRFRPPSELKSEIPKPLEDAVLRCLEPKPEDRFASADELQSCLLKLLQGAHIGAAQKQRASKLSSGTDEKFFLLDVIKEDAYGSVYLYENKIDHKLIVIKKRLKSSSGFTEAKLLTSLKHKNIVNILGASGNERVFIVVMEYLSGGSLKDRLARPMPWGNALKLLREICEGLSFAHKNRIIHGNIRPSNILLSEAGQVKITDFGLDEHYSDIHGANNWYNLRGEPKSVAADIFAVGTLFHQMLTGALPRWQGQELAEHGYLKLLPPELRELTARMLSRDVADRPETVDEIIRSVNGLLAAYVYKNKRAEKKREEATTISMQDEALAPPAPKEAAALPRTDNRRAVRLFYILLLLAPTGLLHMHHNGLLKFYVNAIIDFWGKLVLRLAPLLH